MSGVQVRQDVSVKQVHEAKYWADASSRGVRLRSFARTVDVFAQRRQRLVIGQRVGLLQQEQAAVVRTQPFVTTERNLHDLLPARSVRRILRSRVRDDKRRT